MFRSCFRTVVAAVICVAGLAFSALTAASANADALRPAARVSCSIGGAAAALPFKASPRDPGNPTYDFMQFTATRNGTYAGIAYRSASSDFYLVSRASGKPLTVLRTVHYPYPHATPNAVTAVGFTPRMNLVVAVQNTWYKPGRVGFASFKGQYYAGRTSHYLAAGSGWISYLPTSVASSGRIAGWAATGTPASPNYYVVTWAGETAQPVVLASVGSIHPSVQMTGNGDIAWQGTDGRTVVRTADGSMHQLVVGADAASTGIRPAGASADSIYSSSANGVFRFRVPGTVSAGVALQGSRLMTGSASASWVDTVGPRGDLITGMQSATLHLPDGRQVAMPAQALPSSALTRVISSSGLVAFTSKSDRKVHFLSCH